MEEYNSKYSSEILIKDKKFEIDKIKYYNLYLSFDFSSLLIGVVDINTKDCLYIEKVAFSLIENSLDFLTQLDSLFDGHNFLKVQFWNKVMVCFKSNAFSLVPKSFFESSKAYFFLKTNTPVDLTKEKVLFNSSNQVVSVFSCESKVLDWFSASFSKSSLTIIHHSACVLKSIMSEFALDNQNSFYLHIDDNRLTVIYGSKHKLEYCNIFDFTTQEELLDLIFYVVNELDLNIDNIETIVWINNNNLKIIVQKLKDAFHNLFLGVRPYSLNFSYDFDEIEEYQYFDLLSMHSCA